VPRFVLPALFWFIVCAAVATPSLAVLGIILLVLGGVLSLPMHLAGLPAHYTPYAWFALALIALSAALALAAAGRRAAAARWGTAFVNIAGFIAAIATTGIVNDWSLL
jgi:glucan phosphoethanolaminetransferase (alkaline phosphatase superfamily)